MENKRQFYFAFGRTALKIGLSSLRLNENDKILIPDYICDVVSHPIHSLGLQIVYYPIKDNLTPDLDKIKTIINTIPVQALMIVNYFGQPQDWEQYYKLKNKHNIYLIEDNSHGHGGLFNGQLMGTFGDIGISSPRKILGLEYGGLLYCQNNSSIKTNQLGNIQLTKYQYLIQKLKIFLRYSPTIKSRLKGLLNFTNNWSNPRLYCEKERLDYQLDSYYRKKIILADWEKIGFNRRNAWIKWTNFAYTKGLKPVFNKVNPFSCPWALPVYAKDIEERNKWLKWGSKNGIDLFPWPTLPKEIINQDESALARWKRLLCFPLDV